MKSPAELLRGERFKWLTPLKSLLARQLCSPLVGAAAYRAGGGFIRSRGIIVDTRSPEVAHRTRAQLLFGLYEGAEVRFTHRHLAADRTVIELGSSLGVVTSHAAAILNPGIQVFGVEANHDLFDLASANIARNAPGAHVTIFHGAINYELEEGETAYLSREEDHAAARLTHDKSATQTLIAPVTTLSKLIADHGITRYTLICDIEGAEVGMFLRETKSLQLCQQMIIELHDTSFDGRRYPLKELVRMVEALGFTVTAQYGGVYVFDRTRSDRDTLMS